MFSQDFNAKMMKYRKTKVKFKLRNSKSQSNILLLKLENYPKSAFQNTWKICRRAELCTVFYCGSSTAAAHDVEGFEGKFEGQI